MTSSSILPRRMRVLFADKLPESCVAGARELGYQTTVDPDLTSDDLPGAIAGHDVVVVRSTHVEAATVDAADALGLIIRAGAGTNTIDVDAAAAAAIQVANVPGKNAIAVAELTFGLLLSIDRRIADGVADSRAGAWNKKLYSKGRGVFGRTIGIVGLGAIGLAVAERARAFGMRIVVLDRPGRSPSVAERLEALGVTTAASLEELVGGCDVVSIHVPAAADTTGIMNAELLSHARPGTIVLNTSRGDTIDEDGLIDAVEQHELWLGLDVYPDEPGGGHGEFDSALARHPRVYATHHIGASTNQAQEAVGDGVVEILRAYRDGTEIDTVVNLAPLGQAHTTIVVRHKNRVGVLSDVLGTLRRAGLNVEDMSNRIFAGAEAALATIHVGGAVDDAVVVELEATPNVLAVSQS